MSNLKTTFDDQLMKAKFVEILKQLGDLQLFAQFYDLQRLCLKTKGLIGQFLKMDVARFQGLMKIKLNVHADWECCMLAREAAPSLPGLCFGVTTVALCLAMNGSMLNTKFDHQHVQRHGWRPK